MKKKLALAVLVSSMSLEASVKIQEEFYVMGETPTIVKELVDSGSVIIDHVTSRGFEIYGGKGLSNFLDHKKIPYFDMKEVSAKILADYPSFTEITKKLMALQAKRPDLFKVFSIGKSVKGRDLWMVKVSDNVNTDEVEPEFKFISSMHGDEITGRELTIKLLEEMAEKYGKDPEITQLINNTEIYIMPSMNPDGSDLHQRANSNGVDLNRNFPDMTRERQSSAKGREIETQSVMNFQASRQFALSANFHGGTIVANYPWDSTYDRHPMDKFVQELALGYAENNPEMRNSTDFNRGITNGADWYVVKGGMQDWSYFWFNDLQITIELSHEKWPNYSEIPSFYQNNRNSMMAFMKEIHSGAGIKFNRSNVEGTIRIKQNSPEVKDYGSFSFHGSEFYKVLPEGDYTFTIQEKNGSTSKLELSVPKSEIKANGNFITLN
ncbi:MAG: M14 family zinc carboxypeptidase [Bacteriovoracaceae bacterium]